MISRRQTIGGLGALALIGATPAVLTADGFKLTIATIDAHFDGRDGPACARCPTGEPYVCLVIGGLRQEGEPVTAADTVSAAIDEWLDAFGEYAAQHPYPSRLYWRTRPEIEERKDEKGQALISVYSRLILTNNPELSDAEQRRLGIIA